MKSTFLKLSFFVLALVVFGCGESGEELTLRLKFVPGEVDRVFAATVITGVLESQHITEMTFTMDEVKRAKNVIDVKVVRISSHSDSSGKNESYDSKRNLKDMTESEKSVHAGLQDVLNKSFLISIDDKGNVVEGFKSKETNLPSKEIIDITNIYIPFPDEPVRIGSEWKKEKVNSLTKGKMLYTYKVVNITETEIGISIVSEFGGIGGEIAKNTVKGKCYLDKKTCKLKRGDYIMNLQSGDGKVGFKLAMQK
ncbi:hypothetical protein [Flavobacterium macacae]|mgnify:FL=1|uniref:Lipoprotein n=1 Tax=Flavobacterium macacae TaxID=2488993 RepID=A0A3P3W5Q9_9FLAO|nr:hypothetical protein [Flavobacterium macacae]RRJ89768.1 hypothetical protein EG849_12220 [Flavobacterium macacae]